MSNKSIIESILYTVGSEGIELATLKKILNIPTDDIRNILKEIGTAMSSNPDCGVVLNMYGEKYYLLTKPENNEFLAKLVNVKTRSPLTPALLETLAIIAYNQPCTRSKIEEIRNIDPTFAVDRLTELGLIENLGKAETPGSPYIYGVTQKFFDLFGIKTLKDLPPIDEVNFDVSDEELNFFDSSRQ